MAQNNWLDEGSTPVPKPTSAAADTSWLDEQSDVVQDNALVRGFKKSSQSIGITKGLVTGDSADTARKVAEAADYARKNPGMQEGKEIGAAWERGDGIFGGVKEVAGEFAKDWREAPGVIKGLRATGRNLRAMGEKVIEQVPNMAAPVTGMVGGALAGGAAGSAAPIVGNAAGAAVGGWVGASAGNTLVEGGGMVQEALQKAGISPQDTAAVEKYLTEHGDTILGQSATKGAIIGAVDTLTAGLGGRLLNAPARAAASRALGEMGVNVADKAAVKAAMNTPEFKAEFKAKIASDATYQASKKGAGNIARNVGAAALDPAGEFAGEFVGQGVATGEWDTKNAALEAFSSIGQSGAMFSGQKAYQALTRPAGAAEAPAAPADAGAANAMTTSPGAADPNAPAGKAATPPEAPDLTTTPGAGVQRDGMDFTREVDTSGLSLQDPAELARARAATVDYQPGDTTPQWDTQPGAAAPRTGLDMPAPEFDTGSLGIDNRTPSERMGLDPAKGSLTRAAALAVDTGASPVQFLGATGRDMQLRQTGPGVTNESNVIDVQGRVVEDRAIGTQRRLTAQESARESGAIAFREGVPRSEIAAIPNVIHRAQQLRGYDDAAQKASSVPALPAPTNLREGMERIRAQRQEAANAQGATPETAPSSTPVPAAGTGAVEAAGVKPAGQQQLSADEQAAQDREEARAKEPSLPPALSARLQEAHKAHGRDVKRSVVERGIANEKANNTGTPKAKRERADRIARLEADLALFDEAAAMPPKEAAGLTENKVGRKDSAQIAQPESVVGGVQHRAAPSAITPTTTQGNADGPQASQAQQADGVDQWRKSDETNTADFEEAKAIIQVAMATLRNANARQKESERGSLEWAKSKLEADKAMIEIARSNILAYPFTAGPEYQKRVDNYEASVKAANELESKIQAATKAPQLTQPITGEGAGVANRAKLQAKQVSPQPKESSEPKASQTQQGSAQQPQAGGPQAGPAAAPTTASTSPAGGNRVQAAGLTNGAPAENPRAQAAPAGGTQRKAPRATAEQLTGAQERWQRMTTAERQAVAARTDVKPIVRKNVHRAAWADLNRDVQRKLADAMDSRAETGANQVAAPAQQAQAATENVAISSNGQGEKAIRYELPPEKYAQQQGNESWMAAQSPSFKPTARQQLLMDAVAKALDDGAFYNRDVDEHVAKALGVTLEQRARNSHGVEGGDFGFDVYNASKAVEAQRGNAKSREFAKALNLKPGDLLGTLVFNDGKVTTGVKVIGLSENGLIATINGKRGAAALNGEAGVDSLAAAMDRAKERGKRKDGYAEYVAGRGAVQPSPQPITRADVTAAQQQAATLIGERIDAMTAGEVNKIAKKFLPTMGMKPTMSKANNKAAMTDSGINLEAAAAEVGATLPAEVTRALRADTEGRVVDAQSANENTAQSQQTEPNPLEHTPKQYADAWLRWSADTNGLPLAEVREMQGDEAGLKAIEQRWVDAVVQEAKSGKELPAKTLDKLLEVRPNAQLPESAIPDGYQRTEARKAEKEDRQARADNRKKVEAKEDDTGNVVLFSRSGAQSANANDQTSRSWYDRFVSLLPDAYRNDPHRREPLPAEDWNVQRSAEVREKIDALNKQLRGANDRKGYGPVSVDGLGNLQVDARSVSAADLSGPIRELADELGAGVAATNVRSGDVRALLGEGFVSETSLAAIADRLMGRPFAQPVNTYAKDFAPGAILTYKPRGFPAALFARSATPPADSNARNVATQMLVDGLKENWTRAPEIIVARNMQDPQVPQAVRDYDAQLKSQGSDGEARGFIYKGKVYLLSDQLKGPQQIAEVLFHEVLGHYGLRGAFGDGLTPILQQMGTMRRKEVVAKAREYGLFDKDALGGLDKKAASDAQIWAAMSAKDRLSAAEEVLAEMAQTQPTIGFVQRAIAAIRNWLRANVPGFKSLALTDNDIIQAYILPARGFVTRSKETGAQSLERAMLAFSRVWHGSPHKFLQFDSSKIGTGEGAQAYGHGLYLAESKGVAGSYQESLSTDPERFLVDGKEVFRRQANGPAFDVSDPKTAAIFYAARKGDKAAREYFAEQGAWGGKAIAELDAMKGKAISRVAPGNLYQVDLPDEHIAKMLDWDKPLSEQTPEVRKLAEKFGYPLDRTGGDFQRWSSSPSGGLSINLRGPRDRSGLEKQSANMFSQAGIPGIRYLDSSSRGNGAGTSNYVIFPGMEKILTIIDVNGEPVTGAEKAKVLGEQMDLAFSRTPGDQTQTDAFKRWFKGSKAVDADGKPLVVYHGTENGGFSVFGGSGYGRRQIEKGIWFSDESRASEYAGRSNNIELIPPIASWDDARRYADSLNVEFSVAPEDEYDAGNYFVGDSITDSLDEARDILQNSIAENGQSGLYPVYLKINKPKIINAKGKRGIDVDVDVEQIKANGFDGIIIKNVDDPGRYGEHGYLTDNYVVFSPEQIKSAIGNRGTFDPANPDIRFSRAASPSTATAASPAWDAPVQTGFDDVIYKLQDKNIDLKRVVEAITKSAGQVADSINAYLKEELFHKRAAKRVADFGARELKPLMNQMRLAGLSMEDVEEYLHARHAKEANAALAERNPSQAMINAGRAQAAQEVTALAEKLEATTDKAQRGILQKALTNATKELNRWNIVVPYKGTEESRLMLSGMSDKAADSYFAKLDPAQRAKLEAVTKKVDAIIAGTRQLYVDYGLENQAVVDGWASLYKNYIPLMREDKDGGMGIGQGFSVKGKEVKGRTGSTRKVVDILANIASQREKLIVRGEKNRVTQALVGLAQANPNPEFWEVRSQAPTERVVDEATNTVVDRPIPNFKGRDNVVVAKTKDSKGNVTEQMVVFNEDNPRAVRMAAAMKNLDAGNLEGLLGVSAKITRYFSAINTQYNPVFGVVNLIRDVQGAMVNLAATPLAGQQGKIAKDTVSALRGIYSDIRKTRRGGQATSQWAALWEQMQDDGGTTGYRELFKTSADRGADLKSILNPEGWMDSKLGRFFTADGRLKVPVGMAKKGAGFIFDWLSDYNEAMENGVRLAAYKAALDMKMSREQAASIAKNLTVNFNRKGQVGQQAGAVYAFFNAAMQGTARIGQTLFDMDGGDISTLRLSKTGKAVVYGGITLGAIQALALAAAGFDAEDPPEFVRERSLIIPTGGKTYVTIPMPLGLHVIPGIGRHAVEFALSGFDKPAQRAVSVAGMFADAFNPIGNAGLSMQTIAPTALDPIAALTENKDWTGKPIARVSSNKALPGHTQWKDTATGFSKVVAEAINWISGGNEYVAGAFSPTPDQIDYLIAQLGGGVAREAAKVQQTVSSTLSGEELPTYKVPLVGRFVGNAASQASQGSAFYANLNKLNELETEIKGLQKDGRFAEASQLIRANPQAILIAMANRAERDVQRLRREKRELIAKDASREQVRAKEEQITAVMMRLNQAAERRKAVSQ